MLQISLILCLLQGVTVQQASNDTPLGDEIVVVQASCNTKVKACSASPCRYFCPEECDNVTYTKTYNNETKVCREVRYLLSEKNAVDIVVTPNRVLITKSDHSSGMMRRDFKPFCQNDLKIANDVSICITTCALPDYVCPRRFKRRCACPSDKPILKDEERGICVKTIKDCPPYEQFVLPYKNGLQQFNFGEEPSDRTLTRGDTTRIFCKVNGNTRYRYYWYKTDKILPGSHAIMGSKDEYLLETGKNYIDLTSIQPSDAGFYHCVVSTSDSIDDVETKYTLVSNSGYLKVEYFNVPPSPPNITTVSRQANNIKVTLNCPLPAAEPPVEAVWYKNGTVVNDRRKFVAPVDPQFDEELGERARKGTLYILMLRKEDEGVYECRTVYNKKEYSVAKINLIVSGQLGQPAETPQIAVEMQGKAKVGEAATFFCAGIGNPVPDVTWSYDEDQIEDGDQYELQDFNRRLIVKNVNETLKGPYTCSLSRKPGSVDRQQLFYLSVQPRTFDIKFVTTPSSHTIIPNRYLPFTLECVISVDSIVNYTPAMYWIRNGNTLNLQDNPRVRPLLSDRKSNGVLIRNSTLVFEKPNESDIGIYQCIAGNKEQMRQATAFVEVERRPAYDVYFEREYRLFSKAVQMKQARKTCKEWDMNGHLVTISNKNESEAVFQLMASKGVREAWLGLMSDNKGNWNWVSPNAIQSFSYWYKNNPDNAKGNETFAITDISKAGRWRDVSASDKYPLVCVRYTAKCPSVSKFFNGSAKPAVENENDETVYNVGRTIALQCVDKAVTGSYQTVTCTANGFFEPASLPCPVVSGTSLPLDATTHVITLLVLMRSILT